jgi:uncharacterized protein
MLEARKSLLESRIRQLESVAVAFSAGIDSTYLLAACHDVLGPARVLAITARSASLPAQELAAARNLAARIGVPWESITTDELHNPDYVRNDARRCFHCKATLFSTMLPVARARGLAALAYGANADDSGDFRPGMQAAQQFAVAAPLQEAGLTKADIRALARQRGLPNHDKPAMACLASRVAYGRPVTIEVLQQIEQAEAFLRAELGLRQVRVRHHGKLARLEVEAADLPTLAQPAVRQRVVAHLRGLGFAYVTLDLEGFRSGSMNALLRDEPGTEQQL